MGPGRPRLAPVAPGRPRGPARASSTPRSCTGVAPASRSRSRPPRSAPRASPPPGRASRSAAGSPRCFGSQGAAQDRCLRRDRAAGGLRRQVAAHDGQARRRRLDPERHQDLHLERRHRRRHGRGGDRRPGARPPRPGVVHRHEGQPRPDSSARRSRSSASAPRRPPRSCSRTAASPATHLLGGEEKLAEEARARALGSELRALGCARDLRDHPADGRRFGARDRAGRLRVDARVPLRSAARTACRCSSSSASSRCWPTSRPRSRRRACSSGGRPGWVATASR